MNALSVVVFASAVAFASAGLLGAPVGVAYGGVGQLSTQAGALNSASQSLRISQSARPVAYATQAYAAPAYATQAYAAPIAQPLLRTAVAQPLAYGGAVSTQAGALTTQTQSLRISQSARPVAYAAAPAYATQAYAAPAYAAQAYATPLAASVPAIGSHVAYGYTPLATSLLG